MLRKSAIAIIRKMNSVWQIAFAGIAMETPHPNSDGPNSILLFLEFRFIRHIFDMKSKIPAEICGS